AECIDSCKYFASFLTTAFTAQSKNQLIKTFYKPQTAKVSAIAAGTFLEKDYQALSGSGYVIESLESALWCFHKADSFREAVLLAANIGNDADTTAAICGQIAGAYYGYDEIAIEWREKLHEEKMIRNLAKDLVNSFVN
ncbi:MAG: ADP-ribosylglycohydrolase family protein, partial [Moraxellaceae bacterium]